MKTKKPSKAQRGKSNTAVNPPMDKSSAAERLAEAAREHLRMVKAEHKRARKAFKLAKKVVKKVRKKRKNSG